MSKLWHFYVMFFHFNPAGFLFIHIMGILFLAAFTTEKLSCKSDVITWLKRKN